MWCRPLGDQTVVRVEGVDGVAGVVYEIHKQCKPLLIQFALEDQLQVVQLLDSKFDSTKPAQQLELTPKPWWFDEKKWDLFSPFLKGIRCMVWERSLSCNWRNCRFPRMGHVHKDKMPLQLKSFMLGHRFSDTPPATIDSISILLSSSGLSSENNLTECLGG